MSGGIKRIDSLQEHDSNRLVRGGEQTKEATRSHNQPNEVGRASRMIRRDDAGTCHSLPPRFGTPTAQAPHADFPSWADGIQRVEARCDGAWELPVLGALDASIAALSRPGDHVKGVGDSSNPGLPRGPDQTV